MFGGCLARRSLTHCCGGAGAFVAAAALLGAALLAAPGTAAAASPPVSKNASAATRALLADLYARSTRKTDRVLIGQQLITWQYGAKTDPNAWYGDWMQYRQQGLPLPEIMGGELSDLMRYGDFYPNVPALNELIRHGRTGHVVTLVWHPQNPVAGGDFGTPISTAELRRMVDDSTGTGKRWQVQLARAAAVLKRFADAGVPVMLRPLHEQNGTFFWWGHDGSTGAALTERKLAWTAVWKDLVAELSARNKLDNLLFVFGTNQVNYNGVAPPLTYYPGKSLVDVVSIDTYDEELDLAGASRGLQYYNQLISTGKPFGLSEFGQSYNENGTGANANKWDARNLAVRLRDSYKQAVFAISWYSSREGEPPVDYTLALPDVAHTDRLLADPLIDTQ
jgi:mannan endo-1,4-beta-mannosidase